MNFKNGEAVGIPRGITRNAHPFGLFPWGASDAVAAIGRSDDFFAVFPSQFPSVTIKVAPKEPKIGLSDRVMQYLGEKLVAILHEIAGVFKFEFMEFFIRGIRRLSTPNDKKREVYVDLPHVQFDILRVKKRGVEDDYNLCAEIAAYIYKNYKVLARETKRYYFDLKYETVYGIYRDCCPNPCDAFYIFDNNNLWARKRQWYVPATGQHFKSIKTKKF